MNEPHACVGKAAYFSPHEVHVCRHCGHDCSTTAEQAQACECECHATWKRWQEVG